MSEPDSQNGGLNQHVTVQADDSVVHYVVTSDAIATTDHASVRKMNEELGEVGYAESERDGLRSRTERLEDGSYATDLSGKPVRGEHDSLLAGRMLVEAMNLRGASWVEPRMADAGDFVDCVAESATGRERLLIQVVRAICDSSLYQQLAEQTSYQSVSRTETCVAQLSASVEQKRRALGNIERASLVLVLDANRLPIFSMTDVRTAVADQLAATCAAAGFKEVWVVGPIVEYTYRVWPTDTLPPTQQS